MCAYLADVGRANLLWFSRFRKPTYSSELVTSLSKRHPPVISLANSSLWPLVLHQITVPRVNVLRVELGWGVCCLSVLACLQLIVPLPRLCIIAGKGLRRQKQSVVAETLVLRGCGRKHKVRQDCTRQRSPRINAGFHRRMYNLVEPFDGPMLAFINLAKSISSLSIVSRVLSS